MLLPTCASQPNLGRHGPPRSQHLTSLVTDLCPPPPGQVLSYPIPPSLGSPRGVGGDLQMLPSFGTPLMEGRGFPVGRTCPEHDGERGAVSFSLP